MERRFFCINAKNPRTGKRLSAKSTGTFDRAKAEYVAMKWLYEGIPSSKTADPRTSEKVFSVDESLTILKNIDNLSGDDVKRFLPYFKNQGFISDTRFKTGSEEILIHFLTDFWDYDKSLYIKEKLSHGQGITKSYCINMS